MTPEMVVEMARRALVAAFELSLPVLIAAFAAGVVFALGQAATRITDLTLSFVPRLVTVIAVMALLAGWYGVSAASYLRTMMAFAAHI